MGEYIINQKFESMSVEEIFNALLDFCRNKPIYSTLTGNQSHQISEILNDKIIIKRLEATNNPKLSFDEIKKVITLLKEGNKINTSLEEYKKLLTNRVNKTPLLSLLKASKIIVNY